MMVDLNLRVVFDGQKYDINEVRNSDLVALERHFGMGLPRMRDFTFEQTCFLIWRVLARAGAGPGPFDDDFIDRVEDIDNLAAGDAPLAIPAEGPAEGP
jgi:hypothetical protein